MFLVCQVACVQLINALVSTPDDLDFRLHLRNEFVREGLNDPLQVHNIAKFAAMHTIIGYF